MAGSSIKRNNVQLLPTIPVDTDSKLRGMAYPIPANMPIYNSTTQEFKIGTGQSFHNTPPHKHPNQYSNIGHEHMSGFEEKWFRTMPKLVYASAIETFDGLVPCNGQVVSGEIADSLSDIYSGSVQINPVISDGDVTLVVVTSSVNTMDGNYAWNIFNKPVSVDNVFWVSDQWITVAGTTVCSLTIEFKGQDTYMFDGYDIVARMATKTAPYADVPSIKDFQVEASLDGTTWTSVEELTNQAVWEAGELRSFDTPSAVECRFIRFTFTNWHTVDDATLTPGLKRLYLYGKNKSSFTMPKLDAPEGFVFAVPYKDLGIGMKHEEVGDIVYMSSDVKVTPVNRVLVNGQMLNKVEEKELYNVIGYKYDPIQDMNGVTVTPIDSNHTVTVTENVINWTSSVGDDNAVNEHIEFTGIVNVPTYYTLKPQDGGLIPTQWLFEAYDGTTWTTIHDRTFDPNTESFDTKFAIQTYTDDTTITAYRITVITWSGTGNVGLKDVRLYSHPKGYYYIPTMNFNTTDAIVPYIVTRVRTEDINSATVLALQTNIAQVLQVNTNLQTRVTELENQLAAVNTTLTEDFTTVTNTVNSISTNTQLYWELCTAMGAATTVDNINAVYNEFMSNHPDLSADIIARMFFTKNQLIAIVASTIVDTQQTTEINNLESVANDPIEGTSVDASTLESIVTAPEDSTPNN